MLDRFLKDEYSPNKAVTDLAKYAAKARVNHRALATLVQQYKFYHKYAHLSRLTIAAGANLSLNAQPNVGAFFDPGPGGHLKLPHRWAGQTPPPDGGGTRDDYAV